MERRDPDWVESIMRAHIRRGRGRAAALTFPISGGGRASSGHCRGHGGRRAS
ncbi:hypothetical protein [Mycobacterium sp. GA-2829]|uniref:hypothetical protein n=1 Tax=Mycobacterium sp. GA-2829 TaxID=1772283 RepID=UPI00350F8CD7